MTPVSIDSAAALVAMTQAPTLCVAGEVDVLTAAQLRDRLHSLIDRSTGDITVDLAELRFLDATGVNALVAAHRRLTSAGRRLTITRASTTTQRVLWLAGATATLFDDAEPSGDVTTD